MRKLNRLGLNRAIQRLRCGAIAYDKFARRNRLVINEHPLKGGQNLLSVILEGIGGSHNQCLPLTIDKRRVR